MNELKKNFVKACNPRMRVGIKFRHFVIKLPNHVWVGNFSQLLLTSSHWPNCETNWKSDLIFDNLTSNIPHILSPSAIESLCYINHKYNQSRKSGIVRAFKICNNIRFCCLSNYNILSNCPCDDGYVRVLK